MQPLETLGGHNGFATAVNNAGQIVGWAETSVADESCKLPQGLTFHAVMWEPKTGGTQALPPLSGDAASAATGINNRGQVVGISGSCYVAVGDSSQAAHVVGFGSIGDDAAGNARLRAFLWTGGSKVPPGPQVNDIRAAGDDMALAVVRAVLDVFAQWCQRAVTL